MRTSRRHRRLHAPGRALALAAGLLTLSCGGSEGTNTGPPEPDPGPLRVVVGSAPADAGGLLIEISGEVVGAVTPAVGSHRVWERETGAARRAVLVKGAIGPGTLLVFAAADRNDAYTVRVVEAAAGAAGGYAVHAPAEYSLTVER